MSGKGYVIKKSKRTSFIRWIHRNKTGVIIILVIMLVIEVLFTQYTRFIYHTLRCDHQPVSVKPGTTFAGGSGKGRYYVPGLAGYEGWGPDKQSFCSTAEAEEAGYVAGVPRGSIPGLKTSIDEYYESAPEYYLPRS